MGEVTLHQSYLSLGANIGDRISYLQQAVEKLKKNAGKIVHISPVYESESWGYSSQNNYLNCCLLVETKHTPFELLEATKAIEKELGRIKEVHYADRTIDIDILTFDEVVLNTENLVIPHPHIINRDFVLVPLREIAPNLLLDKHFLTIEQIVENRDNTSLPKHFSALFPPK
jgi:2-amino-4-hydroxy-6-hydroxymethyldihydropteridine diphosphokinase